MFTLEDIEKAHSKVTSWADFPTYIKELKRLGILSYSVYVSDGHTVYEWNDGYAISSTAAYSPKEINTKLHLNMFTEQLRKHQQGEMDYPTFCQDAAWCGITQWVMDLQNMKCNYYDNSMEVVISESIAQ